jgi:hypothetical protein
MQIAIAMQACAYFCSLDIDSIIQYSKYYLPAARSSRPRRPPAAARAAADILSELAAAVGCLCLLLSAVR